MMPAADPVPGTSANCYSSAVRAYLDAVFASTGLAVDVVGGNAPGPAEHASTWCSIMRGRSPRCVRCRQMRTAFALEASASMASQCFECFCEQRECAISVTPAGGKPVTLWSQPSTSVRPTFAAFVRHVNGASADLSSAEKVKLERAFLDAPVLPTDRLRRIMAGLANHVMTEYARGRDGVPSGLQPRQLPALMRAQLYVEAHANEPLSAREVAAHAHVDECHLSRLFKRAVGRTLSVYLAERRVANACEMLARSPLAITEIAFAAGFGSVARFNAVFKRMIGMTPSAYRHARAGDRAVAI